MDDINGWQFGVVMVAGYLGAGVFQFPRELVDFGGPDAFWALLVIFVGYFLLIWLFLKVAAIDTEHSFGTVLNRLLTPYIGIPVQGLRIAMHMMLAVLVLANVGQVLESFFLPGTPVAAIEAALVATCLYAAWYGIAVLARTVEAIFSPTLLGSIIIGLLVVGTMDYAWAVPPVFHFYLTPIFNAAYHSAYIFIGFEVIVVLYSRVRVDRRKAAVRWAIGLYGATAAFFTFGYVIVFGTEGPAALMAAQWPPVSALRLASVQGFFISKLGLLVVVLWGLFAMSFVTVRFWCLASDLSSQASGYMNSTRYRWTLIIVALAVMALAQIFPNVVVIVNVFQLFGLPAVMGYLVGLPLVLLPVAWLRERRYRRQGGQASVT